MANVKTLETFILKDKFSLNADAIFAEAQASTFRRAEMMGWTDVSVNRTSAPAFKENEFTCYTFEILGAGVSSVDDSDATKSAPSDTSRSGVAARELNP